jgi:hypothetical protein
VAHARASAAHAAAAVMDPTSAVAYQYTPFFYSRVFEHAGSERKVGQYTSLTPPDPQLKGAWYPGGFNPRTYQATLWFQGLPFSMQLAPLQRGGVGVLRPAERGGSRGRGRAVQLLNAVAPSRLKKRLISTLEPIK